LPLLLARLQSEHQSLLYLFHKALLI